MVTTSPLALIGVIVTAAVTSALLTGLARVLAPRLGFLDCPDGARKAHRRPTPLLGGAAIYLSLLISAGLAWQLSPEALGEAGNLGPFVPMLLISGGLLCGIGLYDDRYALRARTKLFLQIAAIAPFVVWGRSIDVIHLFGAGLDLGFIGPAFTIFWIVACTNVFNLVDGLDGLSGTIGFIVCVTIALLASAGTAPQAVLPSLVAAAAIFGFLLHNWPPAKIFLGDSGSLLIGFLVGALSIESSFKTATGFALAVPLVLVSIPAFDTFMAIVRRKLRGQSMGEADRGHFHHRLQDRGLSRKKSLLAISGLCVAMAGFAVASVVLQNDLVSLGLCVSLLAVLVAGRVFGYDETRMFFRHVSALSSLLADTSGLLRTNWMLARTAARNTVADTGGWQELTRCMTTMGGEELNFFYWDEATDGLLARRQWLRDGAEAASHSGRDDHPAATLPSADHPAWQFSYSLPVGDGRRATLIARGTSSRKLRGQRMVDLFRLFDAWCREWTDQHAGTEVAGTISPATFPLTPGHPAILPGQRSPKPPQSPHHDDRRVA